MATLPQYRIRFSREMRGYEARGVLNGAGQRTTTVAGTASSLIEARWPIQSPRLPRTNGYDGAYLLRPAGSAADRLRQIPVAGLNSQTGAWTPDADWAVAPTNGEAYEVHTHGIEPVDQLTDYLNAALKAIWIKVDVAFAVATDSKGKYVPTTDVDGNPLSVWLVNEDQILSIRQQASVEEYTAVNMGIVGPLRGRAKRDGAFLRLSLSDGYFPTSTIYATVKKPAYYHCRASSSAAFGSQAGLAAGVEANEALPVEEWVVAGALVAAWEDVGQLMETAAQKRADTYLQAAQLRFRDYQDAYWKANALDETTYAPYGQMRASGWVGGPTP